MRDPVFITGKRVRLRTLIALIVGGLAAFVVFAVVAWVVFSMWVSSTIG